MMARLPYVRLIAVLDFAHAFGSAVKSPIGSLARRRACGPSSFGAFVALALFGCLYLTPVRSSGTSGPLPPLRHGARESRGNVLAERGMIP
jgi:hypothetical protein